MNTIHEISLGAIRLGGGKPLFLIAGPCVIESEGHARKIAEQVARIAADAGVPYIYKASKDEANRKRKESAISFAVGHGECRGENCRHGKYENHIDGARRVLWVSEFSG